MEEQFIDLIIDHIPVNNTNVPYFLEIRKFFNYAVDKNDLKHVLLSNKYSIKFIHIDNAKDNHFVVLLFKHTKVDPVYMYIDLNDAINNITIHYLDDSSLKYLARFTNVNIDFETLQKINLFRSNCDIVLKMKENNNSKRHEIITIADLIYK